MRGGELRVHPDAEALARAVAEDFAREASDAVRRWGRFVAVLTGGSSPVAAYRLLGREYADAVPWRQVHLCWGDERCVPPGHPRSNFGMAHREMLRHLPIPPGNVHRIRGELGARGAAEAYRRELDALFPEGPPRFDLVHLGVGGDGHVASLFPFDLPRLLERGATALPALSPAGEPRVTLSMGALNGARLVQVLIPAAGKVAIAARALHGPLDPLRLPVQALAPGRGRLQWLLAADVARAAATRGHAVRVSEVPQSRRSPQAHGSMAEATREQDIQQIVTGDHPNPFSVLGIHRARLIRGSTTVLRAFVPWAERVEVVEPGSGAATEMTRVHDAGFFEALYPERDHFAYRLRATGPEGRAHEFADPYSFPSTLGELDLHLLGEGSDLRMYRKLGAHPCEIDGVEGVRFAVWAPNARRVSVVGDFNQWDGRRHVMRVHPGVGIWEMFVPGVSEGTVYKYEIKGDGDVPFLKSDPVAFAGELRPATASVVHRLGDYQWGDDGWMERRDALDMEREPMTVYEVHLGSWRWADDRPLTYRELADHLPDYVAEMGFTHVEFLPVMEHPYDPSWGYQVTGYFAPTSRFGAPDDFKFLVDRLHQRGIGVILDWVPAHFPKDAHALRRFDGTALYEHEDPRQGEHPDWGTLIFNFGRNEVRNFLVANALFWLDEYHADGLRVDAVASMLYLDYSRKEGEWLPNRYGGRENLEAIDFLRQLNATVRAERPGALMIAEESTAWPGVTQPVEGGGLGFHFKWNMGWMNDFLRFVEQEPIYRKYHFGLLTFSLMYAFSERFVLPISHDEVVHGKRSLLDKMPGDAWQKFANLRVVLGFMWAHPGKQLLFMGSELGEWQEWSEARPLNWGLLEHPLHQGLQRWVRDLNHVYRDEPAFWQRDVSYQGFDWIDFHDVENSVVAFERHGEDPSQQLVLVCNFTPVPRHAYRIGVRQPGRYRELLNSDAECYGGSNLGNGGGVETEQVESHGRPCSLSLTLPPLGILVLKREAEP